MNSPVDISTAVELTKALAWPVLIIIILVAFLKPLRQLANYLPYLLSKTEEFSIGGVSFQLSKSLIEKATPEVKRILKDLGTEEIRLILDTPHKTGSLGALSRCQKKSITNHT